jgi:hypothetical protein
MRSRSTVGICLYKAAADKVMVMAILIYYCSV